ncbi:MAG: hypothetical protein EPGJADBJ_01082 [Saprospiraceae bacterium]|nr:hypothetical protein [Saprospiraceae bacterium]
MGNKAERIAQLNDEFRKAAWQGGHVYMTQGIQGLPPEDQFQVFKLVKTFNAFSEDNDPYEEHDFGAFDFKRERIFWKIDYYDKSMTFGSEDPADPEVTERVMTVMLANEY